MFYILFIGTLAMSVLSAGLVIFFIIYQRRLFRQQLQMQEMETNYQQELLHNNIMEVEKERKRISTDLHDEIGSLFSTLSMKLGQLEIVSDISKEGQGILGDSKELISMGIQSIKRISHSIIPPTLEFFGLGAALEYLCAQTDTAATKISCTVPEELPHLASETALGVYRIMQELLSNTLAHAGATRATMHLETRDTCLVLTYHDNGKGYDKDSLATKKGLGLRNIDSRAAMIKGKIHTESSPGNGVTVTIEIPFTSYENDNKYSGSGRPGTFP